MSNFPSLFEEPAIINNSVSILFFLSRDLSENDISEIPSEVFSKLRSLTHLRLGHSNITKLANDSFKTLTSLKKL